VIYAFKKWLYQRKLSKLEARLVGRKAALKELHDHGMCNFGIAEDIGVLEYQINKLKDKRRASLGVA
jgi:hypothetical protein